MILKPRLPPKLIPVFEGEADVRGAYGGRGSGKSRSFASMTAYKAAQFANAGYRGTILCLREWMNSLADSSFEEVKTAILEDQDLSRLFTCGESFIRTNCGSVDYSFAGLNRNLNSIKGKSRILIAWIDEAEGVTEKQLTVLDNTIREDSSELWLTWNPEIKGSPVDKRFRNSEDPNYKIIEMNYMDNPCFPSRLERNRQRDLIERPEEYDWIWLGAYRTHVTGAVWGKELLAAKKEGRVRHVPHQSDYPVYTAWDIGRSDATAIWFWQYIAGEIHIIDYIEERFQTPDYFAGLLLGRKVAINLEYDDIHVKYGDEIKEAAHRKSYKYDALWLPHDAFAKTFSAKGKSVQELLASVFGWDRIQKVPSLSIQDGIQAARSMISKCYWDEERAEFGFGVICKYQYKQMEDKGTFSKTPEHNSASHGGDSFRYMAIAAQEERPEPEPEVEDLTPKPHGIMSMINNRRKSYD